MNTILLTITIILLTVYLIGTLTSLIAYKNLWKKQKEEAKNDDYIYNRRPR
jgi:hypothetical protein